MNIVVGSAFRNANAFITRYFWQVDALQLMNGNHVRVVAAEGDSIDPTRTRLFERNWKGPVYTTCVDVTHGGPWFGSTEASDRMKALSKIGNTIFDSVTKDDDVLVYVESDLIWDPRVINELVEMAYTRRGGYDVFAPLVFAGDCFYDIWGFRRDGVRFSPFPPYHACLEAGEALCEVNSAGSCLVMRAEIARQIRITNDDCLVGWCENAREAGFKIAACQKLRIHHP